MRKGGVRFGSRRWFVQTPDEIRSSRFSRAHEEISGLDVFEPVTPEETALAWATMRPEERQEAREAGIGLRDQDASARRAERSFAIYHGDALMAIALVERLPDGRRFLEMERTENALKPGHRFTWLRGYGPLARKLTELVGEVLFVTPTDLPRALDVYRHTGAERTGSVVTVGKRTYWVMRIKC